MCIIRCSTDIQTIINLLPCFEKHIWSYSFNCGYDSTFQVADTSNLSLYTMFLMYPRKKKPRGVRSGVCAGHGIGLSLLIQESGNFVFKASRTDKEK